MSTIHNNDIYPGEYHPHSEKNEKLLHAGDALISRFPYSEIMCSEAGYRMNIPVPGIRREDVFIEVSGDHMLVKILNQQRLPEDKQPGKRMRIVRKCFVKLPPEADANFATATIQNSLLTIELAKKDRSTRNVPGHIIPY